MEKGHAPVEAPDLRGFGWIGAGLLAATLLAGIAEWRAAVAARDEAAQVPAASPVPEPAPRP